MNLKNLRQSINQTWDESIIPTLSRYIEIPCKSISFDPDWEKNGYLDQAMQLLLEWCLAQKIPDMQLTLHRLPGRTPLLCIEIPGQIEKTVLLYGHMDKQPEMTGWREDLGPWKPVLKDGRLYGRGGADDGYAVCAAVTAFKVIKEQSIPHARAIILIEASEESGSIDLPEYIHHLKTQIGKPDLVICLDSGANNYDQLWCTTSLRGLVNLQLRVEILNEGVHSGAASGIVPSSFRILRQLLTRIEDESTGEILLKELHVNIPPERVVEAKKTATSMGNKVWEHYPWVYGAYPASLPEEQHILNNTWMPALSVTGVDGMPKLSDAGNVLRPQTSVMLSVRIPPTCDHKLAAAALKKNLEADPPYGAKVSAEIKQSAPGWNAPQLQNWLAKALDEASHHSFGKPVMHKGEGGSIPFMKMLGEQFPGAQFMITGVLGPHSNAHGPNEFLHIDMAKKITECLALVLATQGKH